MRLKFTGQDDHLKDVAMVLISNAVGFKYKANQILTDYFIQAELANRLLAFFVKEGTVKVERKLK